ncbi:hypothetical protein [Halostella sp. PRR32]|uniref:DUF7287 family protein n=1 Tax=Halostella sp. PRR32 TaxID=3098147 RepID=UPI002B1DC790|nr:hypothetical protein [Halostella sp. PRR32]
MIGDDRGQTNQDFAVGVSIFLLTTAFVFAFIPSIFTPFDSEVEDSQVTQADRVASAFLDNYSVADKPGTLDVDRTEEFFGNGGDGDELRDRYDLPVTSQVNVTVRTPNGSVTHQSGGVTLARGDDYSGQPAASTSRVVTFDDGSVCDPSCRLVVRVW